MVRILYSVAGEGMGHATRSQPIIEELSKHHEVLVLSDNGGYTYLKKHFRNVKPLKTLHIQYKNNSVVMLGTFILNLKNIPNFIKSYRLLRKIFKNWRPDILINDFTFLPNYFALIHKTPILTIDNEHIITKTEISRPKGTIIDFMKSWLVVNLIVWKSDFNIITTFFSPKLKSDRSILAHQPIRNKLLKHKPQKNNHILVYQTSKTNKKLFKILESIPEKFIIYNQGSGKRKNLHFKEFHEDNFFKDLSSCKAVIMNGGFSLMNEALYFKKPILSIPVDHQFEQILNAHYLEKFNFGRHLKQTSKEGITKFLAELHLFKPTLHNSSTRSFISIVDKKIKDLVS